MSFQCLARSLLHFRQPDCRNITPVCRSFVCIFPFCLLSVVLIWLLTMPSMICTSIESLLVFFWCVRCQGAIRPIFNDLSLRFLLQEWGGTARKVIFKRTGDPGTQLMLQPRPPPPSQMQTALLGIGLLDPHPHVFGWLSWAVVFRLTAPRLWIEPPFVVTFRSG